MRAVEAPTRIASQFALRKLKTSRSGGPDTPPLLRAIFITPFGVVAKFARVQGLWSGTSEGIGYASASLATFNAGSVMHRV